MFHFNEKLSFLYQELSIRNVSTYNSRWTLTNTCSSTNFMNLWMFFSKFYRNFCPMFLQSWFYDESLNKKWLQTTTAIRAQKTSEECPTYFFHEAALKKVSPLPINFTTLTSTSWGCVTQQQTLNIIKQFSALFKIVVSQNMYDFVPLLCLRFQMNDWTLLTRFAVSLEIFIAFSTEQFFLFWNLALRCFLMFVNED